MKDEYILLWPGERGIPKGFAAEPVPGDAVLIRQNARGQCDGGLTALNRADVVAINEKEKKALVGWHGSTSTWWVSFDLFHLASEHDLPTIDKG